MGVGRQWSNTLQADMLGREVENLQLSQYLGKSKEEVAHICKLAAKNCVGVLSPHRIGRTQPEFAATGRLGTDDATLAEGVQQSSFVAVGDRLPVHLNSSFSTAYLGDPDATP